MRVIVIGASGHARVVTYVIEREGRHTVVGLLDPLRRPGETVCGYPILGREEDLPRLLPEHSAEAAFIAIGDNDVRRAVRDKVRALVPGLPFIRSVHPSAQVGRGAEIGEGTVLMAGAVLNPEALVGAFCIVNTHASLDHDGVMGDFSSLAPGVATGGGVFVGEGAAICIGASVLHNRRVGAYSVVGAGSVVVSDVPEYAVAYGVPARVVRERQAGENYL